MTRRLLPLALAAVALAAPAASAFQQTVTVAGCDVTVSTTDVALLLSNPPQVRTSGPTGASVSC